jgi:metallopeptidase MepB
VSRLENSRSGGTVKNRLTFKYSDLYTTLKLALDAEVRQKVFIENENKVSRALLW